MWHTERKGDLQKHVKSEKHEELSKISQSNRKITSTFTPFGDLSVIKAEILFTNFLVITWCVVSGAGTPYPSGAHVFTSAFCVSSYCSDLSFKCCLVIMIALCSLSLPGFVCFMYYPLSIFFFRIYVTFVHFVGVFCMRNSLLKMLFFIRSPALGIPLDQL